MSAATSWRRRTWVAVFVAGCLPAALIGFDALRGGLGANPIAEILNRLGFWALTFLLASLAPTALKIALGWTEPARYRRMAGLFAFFYAFLHFATYLGVDQFGEVHAKEQSGRRLEEQIETLLRESPDVCGDAKAGQE